MASSGNFCIYNPLPYSTAFRTGLYSNAYNGVTNAGNTCANPGNACTGFGTMALTSGKKWYMEGIATNAYTTAMGIFELNDCNTIQNSLNTSYHNNTSYKSAFYAANGKKYIDGSESSYGATFVAGDVIGMAVDLESDTNTVTFYKNNSSQGSFNLGTNGLDYLFCVARPTSSGAFHMNWGQDSTFAGTKTAGGNADANGFGDFFYSVPSGYLALCSGNLGISADIDPAETDDNIPQKNFGVVTFNGTGTSNAVTGLGFKPDLIWGFTRDGSQSKRMVDSSRGGSSRLYSDTTATATTGTVVISEFGTDGFTANGGAFNNDSGKACGAWCWRANGGTTATDATGDITVTRQTNDASKFTIATWTGNGTSGSTIAHGLGKKPAMTIIKRLNATSAFNVWHQGNNNGDVDSFGELQGNAQWYQNQGSSGPYTTDPTTSLLTLTAYAQVNATGGTYLGYFWADVEGSQKFGKYTGNGNADGPFIYTGFRPRMVFFKRVDNGHNWITFDTATKTFNPNDEYANWDTGGTSAQGATDKIDVLSNGFKLRSTGSSFNNSGSTFVYGAWGDVPFRYNNTF